jgi:hypothetical protein
MRLYVALLCGFCALLVGSQALSQNSSPAMRKAKTGASAAPVDIVQPLPDTAIVPFVDSHVHLNDEPMQLELMQRFGATRAIVFWGRSSDNESVLNAASRHPGLFIPFASISPERSAYRRAWEAQDTALLNTLDELLASGRFKGIGEISAVHFPSLGFAETDFDPTAPMMTGILTLARKHRVPVPA